MDCERRKAKAQWNVDKKVASVAGLGKDLESLEKARCEERPQLHVLRADLARVGGRKGQRLARGRGALAEELSTRRRCARERRSGGSRRRPSQSMFGRRCGSCPPSPQVGAVGAAEE